MKNKFVKYIINILIILVVLGLVLYFSLRDNYWEILSAIKNVKKIWVLFAICLLVLYRLCASLGHYLIIKENSEKVSYFRCLQINFIILFFHGITPFASGGQPMEVYYLHNEGIPIAKSTNITLQNFIVYQISLILVGFVALVYNFKVGIFPDNNLIKKLVILGFMINLLVLVVSFVLSFGKRINKIVCDKIIHYLAKWKIFKDERKVKMRLEGYLASFYHNAVILRKNKLVVGETIFINVLGLLFYYSMPFAILKGFGLDISLIKVLVATSYVMIIGSFVPIPGGTGGIEYSFIFFFNYFLKGGFLHATMLLWRFCSYYMGMIIGAVVLVLYRKGEKRCE